MYGTLRATLLCIGCIQLLQTFSSLSCHTSHLVSLVSPASFLVTVVLAVKAQQCYPSSTACAPYTGGIVKDIYVSFIVSRIVVRIVNFLANSIDFANVDSYIRLGKEPFWCCVTKKSHLFAFTLWFIFLRDIPTTFRFHHPNSEAHYGFPIFLIPLIGCKHPQVSH